MYKDNTKVNVLLNCIILISISLKTLYTRLYLCMSVLLFVCYLMAKTYLKLHKIALNCTIVNIEDRVWKARSRDEVCWIFGHVGHIVHCMQICKQ